MQTFTRQQALATGWSPSAVARAVRSGRLVALRRGQYATREKLAGCSSAGQRHAYDVTAALAAFVRADAVASLWSAATLHDIELLRRRPGVWLTATAAQTWRDLRGVHLYEAGLPRHHVTTACGVPVTTVARTGIDLAQVIRDCRSWPGIRRARRADGFADPLAESVHESACRVLFARLGLPPPRTQVVLGDEAGPIGRVDFYWEQHRTVGEADGKVKYTDPAAVWAEKLREDRLRDAGFEVVRITPYQRSREPATVHARLLRAFTRGSR